MWTYCKSALSRLPEYRGSGIRLALDRRIGGGGILRSFYDHHIDSAGAEYMRLPVFHSGVSLIIHVILVWGLLKYTDLGVYGLVIGNVSFPVIVSLLNMRAMAKRLLPVEMEDSWDSADSVLGMGAVTAISYRLVRMILPVSWLALLASIAASVLAYGMLILRLKCFYAR